MKKYALFMTGCKRINFTIYNMVNLYCKDSNSPQTYKFHKPDQLKEYTLMTYITKY